MIPSILGALLTALLGSSILKPGLHVVWIRRSDGSWEVPNPDGNRMKDCKRIVKQFVLHGIPIQSIIVLPKGARPPK